MDSDDACITSMTTRHDMRRSRARASLLFTAWVTVLCTATGYASDSSSNAAPEHNPTGSIADVLGTASCNFTDIAIHIGSAADWIPGQRELFDCYYVRALNSPFPGTNIIVGPPVATDAELVDPDVAARAANDVHAKGLKIIGVWGSWNSTFSDPNATRTAFKRMARAGYDYIFLDEFVWGLQYFQKYPKEFAAKYAALVLSEAVKDGKAIKPDMQVIVTEPFYSDLDRYLRCLGPDDYKRVDYVGGEDYEPAGNDSIRESQLRDFKARGKKTAQWVMGVDELMAYRGKVDLLIAADLIDTWGTGRVGKWWHQLHARLREQCGTPAPPPVSCGCQAGERLPRISDLQSSDPNYPLRFRGDFDSDSRPDQGAIDRAGRAHVTSADGDSYCWQLRNDTGNPVPGELLSTVVTGDFDGPPSAHRDPHDEIRALQPGSNFSWNYSWSLLGSRPDFSGSLNRSGNPADGYVPVTWLRNVVAGDFDGDGKDEIRALQNQPAGANWWYDWGYNAAPLRQGPPLNSGGATVPIDRIRFVVTGDFLPEVDNTKRDEVRALQAGTNWNYIWGMDSRPRLEGPLQNSAGNAVPVDALRFVVAGNFEFDSGGGVFDEVRALQSDTSWSYTWRTTARPFSEGPIRNSIGNDVPVNWLTDVFLSNYAPIAGNADLVEELTAIQSVNVWWYSWGPGTPPRLLLDGSLPSP